MTDLTLSTRLQRNPDLMSAEMDGELVMMSVENGAYYGIGGVGSRIWTLLAAPISLTEIVQAISRDYEVDAATCEADVLAFAGDLVRNGAAQRC